MKTISITDFVNESKYVNESSDLMTELEKTGELSKPSGGNSIVGKHYGLKGRTKYDSIYFDYDAKSKKPFGIVKVDGHGLPSSFLKNLGLKQERSWTAGVDSYAFNGNYEPLFISEKDMIELVKLWSNGFDSYAKGFTEFYKNRAKD